MADTPETLLSIVFARQALLMQLVRVLLRERAVNNGHTREDVMRWSEEIKQFFEHGTPSVVAESYLTAAVDEFFKVLAAEVEQHRGNQ